MTEDKMADEKEKISDPGTDKPEDPDKQDAAPEVREVPDISANVRGTVSRMLETAKVAYRQAHEGDDPVEFRFGRAPEHNKTHSKIPIHRARGYRPVKVKELELGTEGEIYGGPDDPVRVGDTILLVCSQEVKARRTLELEGRALEQATLSDRVYKESLETAGSVPGRDGVKAGGSIKKTVTEEEVTIPQHAGREG